MTLTEDSVKAFITNYVDVWSECGKRADPKLWKEFVVRFQSNAARKSSVNASNVLFEYGVSHATHVPLALQ